MLIPERQWSYGDGYRYGFNGKENDNEVKGTGNQQDYGMRIYDPRIGRFLSVDPISQEYPELTPYQFASNRPIDGIDLDGLEWGFNAIMYARSKVIKPKLEIQYPVAQKLVSESTCIGCAARMAQKLMIETEANRNKVGLVNYTAGHRQAFFKQGGVDGSKQGIVGKAMYDQVGQFLPGISDLEDGKNLLKELSNGNYKMAAMYGLFLLPGGDFAKPAKPFLTKLAKDGIEYALKNTSRLQHAFKHAKDINQFAGKNWNKQVGEEWKKFNSDILETATKTFDNVLGKDPVKGFYKNIDGQDVVTYIYKGGDKAGEIATTVVLTPNAMTKFGLK